MVLLIQDEGVLGGIVCESHDLRIVSYAEAAELNLS